LQFPSDERSIVERSGRARLELISLSKNQTDARA